MSARACGAALALCVAIGGVAGCARRAASADAAPTGARAAARAVPRLLGEGVISTDRNEFGGAFSPDGQELYYAVSAQRSYRYAMVVARRRGSGWSEPEVLPFSGLVRGDYDPVLSPDGRRMYFVSDRAPDGGLARPADPDLWMVERGADGAWGAPRRLPEPLNGAGRQVDWFASEANDGTLYLALSRDSLPGVNLFRARRVNGAYPTIEPLGAPVDGPDDEAEPYIAPDGSFLLFSAYGRADGHGHYDLYISHRRGDGWGEPINLGPTVNTPARDYSPRLAPDGHTLVFTSERHFALGRPTDRPMTYAELDAGLRGVMNGNGNIYTVDLRALGVLPAPAPAR